MKEPYEGAILLDAAAQNASRILPIQLVWTGLIINSGLLAAILGLLRRLGLADWD